MCNERDGFMLDFRVTMASPSIALLYQFAYNPVSIRSHLSTCNGESDAIADGAFWRACSLSRRGTQGLFTLNFAVEGLFSSSLTAVHLPQTTISRNIDTVGSVRRLHGVHPRRAVRVLAPALASDSNPAVMTSR